MTSRRSATRSGWLPDSPRLTGPFAGPLLALVACMSACSPDPSDAQPVNGAAQAILIDAATAMGGLERIRSIRSLRLYGFGQEADGFGHSNVTGSPHAPQKRGAENDLQRVWDLQGDRYLERQRRNLLFPFAATFGHDFALDRRILDGDIAYSVAEDGAMSRTDDARDLRMWSLANPVVAVRAALADGASLTNVRVEDGLQLVDVTLDSGETFTIATDWQTKLPQFVRWSAPIRNLGEAVHTARFTGYLPYDGIELPLGIVTHIDWRNIELFTTYVDGYVVDGDIPDLAAPASIRSAVLEEPEYAFEAEVLADGVWRISNGTTVIEFADHLTLFELEGGSDEESLAVLAVARSLVPAKPVTTLIVSHAHDDHSSGLRTAVAEGLTIISRRGNEGIFREVTSRPAPNFPDLLHRNPARLDFVPVDDRLRLEDAERVVDVYRVIGNNHLGDGVFAFVPGPNIFVEADIGSAALDWQWWADAYQQNVEYYGLEVDRISPVHFFVMTHAEMIDFIAPGRIRVQQRCADYASRREFLPGCPPFLPRGDLIE